MPMAERLDGVDLRIGIPDAAVADVIIASGLREPEVAAVLLDLLNTPQLSVRRIHRHLELRTPSEQAFHPGYLPFTNPSLPPEWFGPECYRLFALEDPRRVYDLILESAHKLA